MDNKLPIYIIDYNCIVDSNKKPLGHTFGLAQKLLAIIGQLNKKVVYVCSPEYAAQVPLQECAPILESTIKGKSTQKDEMNIIKRNFRTINEKVLSGILFFTHVNVLFSKFMPTQNKNRKIIGIVFGNLRRDKQSDGFFKAIARKYIYNRFNSILKKKIGVVIKTNKNLDFYNENIIYMPDYYYSDEEYLKYKCEKQRDLIVCLGQNNQYKKILVAINKFKDSKYRLYIAGKFLDEKLYNEAMQLAHESNNIIIEDKNLSKSDYLSLLAKAKYCILPYDKDFYYKRTTGIAIEAMFMDTIVIGPSEILDFNNIAGIQYNNLEMLDLGLLEKEWSDVLKIYAKNRCGEYSKDFSENAIRLAIEMANNG